MSRLMSVAFTEQAVVERRKLGVHVRRTGGARLATHDLSTKGDAISGLAESAPVAVRPPSLATGHGTESHPTTSGTDSERVARMAGGAA